MYGSIWKRSIGFETRARSYDCNDIDIPSLESIYFSLVVFVSSNIFGGSNYSLGLWPKYFIALMGLLS